MTREFIRASASNIWIAIRTVLVLVGAICLLKLATCADLDGARIDRMSKLASPDGKFVLYYLWNDGAGAMDPWTYRLVLATEDEKPGDGTTIMFFKRVEGLRYGWVGPRKLAISLECGDVFNASNYFYRAKWGEPVSISLNIKGGSCDPLGPST